MYSSKCACARGQGGQAQGTALTPDPLTSVLRRHYQIFVISPPCHPVIIHCAWLAPLPTRMFFLNLFPLPFTSLGHLLDLFAPIASQDT